MRGVAKVRLLPHEARLLEQGALEDVSHAGARARWLFATSATAGPERALVYRHMGDVECAYLLEHDQLPSTQPYQTITRGDEGRTYCEVAHAGWLVLDVVTERWQSYLRANKKVDTHPTTVVGTRAAAMRGKLVRRG